MVKERVLDFANHINRTKRERRVPLRKRIPNTEFLNRSYRTKWPIWECSLNYASRKAPTRLPRLRVSRSNGYQNCWPNLPTRVRARAENRRFVSGRYGLDARYSDVKPASKKTGKRMLMRKA